MHQGVLLLLIFLAAGVGLKGPLLLIRLISKRRSSLYFASHDEEHEVKAVDCSYCDYHIEGADEELFDQLQIHIEQAHPDLQLTDEQIGDLLATNSYRVLAEH
jgi:predicted small metal-binding protein